MEQLLLIIFSFIIFLFPLYVLCRDDYALSKKNVSPGKVFDLAFVFGFLALLFARIFYVVFNFTPNFFNPLYFFHLLNFPGISFSGGMLALLIFILLYSKSSKLPVFRIFDFFAISLVSIFPVVFLIKNAYLLTLKNQNIILFFLELLIYIVLAVVFVKLFQKAKMEEGSPGFLILSSLTFVILVFKIFEKWNNPPFYIYSDFLTVLLFLSSLTLYMQKEDALSKLKITGIVNSFKVFFQTLPWKLRIKK